MNKRVIVVDLDGTLYTINTFHHYLKFLVIEHLKSLKFWVLLKFSMVFLKRVLGVISHAEMKYKILSWSSQYNLDHQKFVNAIKKYQNKLNVLETNTFDYKILATAAPYCYASIIATHQGFDYCIATQFLDTGFTSTFDNIRVVKKENVEQLLMSLEIDEIDTLITDHIDDLPLMKISKEIVIVNPSERLKNRLNDQDIAYKVELH